MLPRPAATRGELMDTSCCSSEPQKDSAWTVTCTEGAGEEQVWRDRERPSRHDVFGSVKMLPCHMTGWRAAKRVAEIV